MWFTNGRIFTPRGEIRGSFEVRDGRFCRIQPGSADRADALDLRGARVIPGLVDIHIHGSAGADFSDGDADGLTRMARSLARRGVTSFAPTSMSLPRDVLRRAFRTARALRDRRPEGCARVMGIHMEGPFFSRERKGAQNGDWLIDPDIGFFEDLMEDCGGLVRIVDLAPELPGSTAFVARASRQCTVSIAHTDATYEDARAAFEAGARHLTHLFNCMPPMHHRRPGVIGAAFDREDVAVELICDGYHVHPSAVRMAFALFPGRICLISDAIRCCGMEDGEYELGGQPVRLRDGVVRLADGTIAGSASDLFTCMRRAISFGIPEAEAIAAATIRPAREIGAQDVVGSIEPGKLADFVVCDEGLSPRAVYIGAERAEAR